MNELQLFQAAGVGLGAFRRTPAPGHTAEAKVTTTTYHVEAYEGYMIPKLYPSVRVSWEQSNRGNGSWLKPLH